MFGVHYMKKRLIVGLLVITVLVAIASWRHWQAGHVIIRSRNSDRHFFNEIVVREMPIKKNPIWMFLRYDRYNYQCEFHTPMGKDRPWSLQTYTADSFQAKQARVEWRNETQATVYLDNHAVFICSNGWWIQPSKETITEPAGGAYVSPAAGDPSAHP